MNEPKITNRTVVSLTRVGLFDMVCGLHCMDKHSMDKHSLSAGRCRGPLSFDFRDGRKSNLYTEDACPVEYSLSCIEGSRTESRDRQRQAFINVQFLSDRSRSEPTA